MLANTPSTSPSGLVALSTVLPISCIVAVASPSVATKSSEVTIQDGRLDHDSCHVQLIPLSKMARVDNIMCCVSLTGC